MQETALTIRPARNEDREALASILVPVVRAGETYALDRDLSEDAILAYWLGEDRATFVAEEGGLILGTYYLRKNQAGGGSHPVATRNQVRAKHQDEAGRDEDHLGDEIGHTGEHK